MKAKTAVKKYLVCAAAAVTAMVGASYHAAVRDESADTFGGDDSSSVQDTQLQLPSEIKPIAVSRDVADESAGENILYCHDGLTVTLERSVFDIRSPFIGLKISNESEKTMVFSTEYTAVNGISSDTSTLAIVEPGSEAERSLVYLNSCLPEGEEITDVAMRFFFNVDGEYDTKRMSEQIKLTYEDSSRSFQPPENYTLIQQFEGVSIYAAEADYAADDTDGYEIAAKLYIENPTANPYILTLADNTAFGSSLYEALPADSVCLGEVKFSPDDSEADISQFAFSFILRDPVDFSELYISDTAEISLQPSDSGS